MAGLYFTMTRYSSLYLMKSVAVRASTLCFPREETGVVCAARQISSAPSTMEEPVIDCKLGKLRGRIAKDYLGGKYYSFQGIPYARAPVGDLRFKAPQPPEKWTGVLDATKEGPACPSIHMLFMNYIGREDNCLNLNVYTKEMPNSKDAPRPVMVWIHGGAFMQGSNSTEFYSPNYLMTEDVIQVIINYRLGIFGFLCLEDDSLGVMGNAGLKDQVMALKWVKDNISCFGGDPNNVTIYGESAGSASVNFQMLSPSAKGLFHKAILQSGCVLNPWASGHRGAAHVTKYLGIKETDEKEILEQLRKTCPKKLVSVQMKAPEVMQAATQRVYGPVVEHPSAEAFLTEEPLAILQAGNYNKVPLIIGMNSNEGILFEFVRLLKKIKEPVDCEMEVPFDLGVKSKTEVSSLIAEKIRKFYKLDEGSEEQKMAATHKGELNYFKKLACSKYTMTYFFLHYLMNKPGMKSICSKLGNSLGFRNIPGACHADDLGYLFPTFFTPQVDQSCREWKMVKRMVELWTNFAKYGNPTPENDQKALGVSWKPVEKKKHHYMNLGDELKMESYPFKERNEFWDQIYKEYRKN